MNPNDHSPAAFDLTQKQEEPQNRYKITVGGIVCTKQVPMPIKWEELLDERLDSCRMTVKQAKKPVIEPLTEVKIEITDKLNKTLVKTWVVSADSSSEVPVGSGRYNHELILVEETKKLEGIIIEPLTYTNALGRSYDENAYSVPANKNYKSIRYDPKVDAITAPKTVPEASVPPTPEVIEFYGGLLYIFDAKIDVTPPNKETQNLLSVSNQDPAEYGKWQYSATFYAPVTGMYTVRYYGTVQLNTLTAGPIEVKYDVSYIIAVISDVNSLPKWNITSVIDRLLDLAEPHLKNDTSKPRYKLNETQAAEFAKIESPEFSFSKMTLKEALDQIGGFIHGVPRLKGNKIYFDMLGGTEQAKLADPKYPYISNQLSQDIENYATKLDSTADNLVNMLDSDEGVIVEPYSGGYKSVRTEELYAIISEDAMIIQTIYPIYDVSKLEFELPNTISTGVQPKKADITAYVFEAADYGTMSSFDGGYPTSKSYAIYYKQGEKNVKGLSYKAPSVIGGAESNYAITNIIKATTGYDISQTDWISNYPLLKFRITYTPIFSSRVEQHKLYYKDMQPRTLTYNQSANLIETRFYGENLKGTIARMGNTEVVRTYRLNSTSLIPKIGQAWGDDYFVSAVTVAMYPFYFDCTVGLTKDYNRLSQYIGINSSRRMFEVSEKQAYNREMIYTDYAVITQKEPITSDNLVLSVIEGIANIFTQSDDDPRFSAPITVASFFMKIGLPNITLPVISIAMGNGIIFSCKFQDNYSAGARSDKGTDGKYYQTDVEYSNYYGRFDTMDVRMSTKAMNTTADTPFELPQGDYASTSSAIKTPAGNPVVVRKDGREIISFSYQVHFVTDIPGLITGAALTHNCPLVSGIKRERAAKLFVLKHRIGKFDRIVNMEEAELVYDYRIIGTGLLVNTETKSLKLLDINCEGDPQHNGKAWAIVDANTKELLIGKNEVITANTIVKMPYITLVHDLYKEDEE